MSDAILDIMGDMLEAKDIDIEAYCKADEKLTTFYAVLGLQDHKLKALSKNYEWEVELAIVRMIISNYYLKEELSWK